jgi:glucose uptake protein
MSSMLYALLAGIVLNCGNVLLTAALSLVGMAVAFPIALGLSIVVSTILSYLISPKGNPVFLFAGVIGVLIAVVFSSLAYRAREVQSAVPSQKGFLLSIASGILFCGFGPLVTKAFASPSPVGPYGAAVLFTAGAFLSTFPLMGYFMRHPVQGAPLRMSQFWRSSPKEHAAGLFGGLIWGSGTVLTFAAANYVGMALAGAIGQANSLIAAFWGVFVWREFRGASVRAKLLLVTMFAFYIGGIALVACSH